MAGIRFDDYFLSKLSYNINPNYDQQVNEIDVTPNLDFGVKIFKSSSKVATKLGVTLGNLSSPEAGFQIDIEIIGTFLFDNEEIEEYDISFESFIKESTISILWSFIRPFVSDMITRGNSFPNYILPVINVVKLVSENDIEVEYEE
ncbi:protein-export chaperone SecB [Tetragenococcus halophilus]|uniref:protein-export chaperone SecB n=1 Tax=Tetragenococcus halophilus TaxID=51669 RepID=UPI0015BCC4E0|nr:protein-export chaperone SecB [Tetragenococcus halophilus]NWO00695.1 preprotein translocase subunit SecB [Tetragenococcus halophilus]